MSDDTASKVREMARLSLMHNKINPIQEKNLKMYPFVFFEGVTTVKIDYDLSCNNPVEVEEDPQKTNISYKFQQLRTKHFRVTYYLELDESKNDKLDKRFEAIETSVRNLFWKETSVQVYFNGKLVFGDKKDGE